jgi:hypothetical protein
MTMPRFSLRTLIVVMLLGGPALAIGWWRWGAWRVETEQHEEAELSAEKMEGWPYPPPEVMEAIRNSDAQPVPAAPQPGPISAEGAEAGTASLSPVPPATKPQD